MTSRSVALLIETSNGYSRGLLEVDIVQGTAPES
jgi:hypothetical protein